jgi:ASC-1-like (ASCH) protein
VIHVAILLRQYLDLLLSGRKTIELRLTVTNRAPFQAIEPGERIYFKQSAAPFRATAIADHVLFADDLTPKRVQQLKRDYNDAILGDSEFWKLKREAKYATLVWVRDVEPVHFGPQLKPQRGIAWVRLPEELDVYPLCVLDAEMLATHSVELTPGNVKNSHVYVRRIEEQFPKDARGGRTRAQAGRPIRLLFRDGTSVQTDIVEHNGLIRARGPWRRLFADAGAEAGDRICFLPQGGRRFRVDLLKAEQARRIDAATALHAS